MSSDKQPGGTEIQVDAKNKGTATLRHQSMCGIHAVISCGVQDPVTDCLSSDLQRRLCNRGPDHLGEHRARRDLGPDRASITLDFTSTVLSLRGDHIARQPLVDSQSGSALCWNGEAWKLGGSAVKGNDAELVCEQLRQAAALGETQDREHAILDTLRAIEGPFSLVYYDAESGKVFFGRDRLGRRSLLTRHSETSLVISSVGDFPTHKWDEVEADGIYVLDLGSFRNSPEPHSPKQHLTRHDWLSTADDDTVLSIGHFNTDLPHGKHELLAHSPAVRQLRHRLTESLKLRLLHIPVPPARTPSNDTRVAVLFSGGLDCTILARLAHDIVPPNQGIDLLNVAFENPRVAAQLRKAASASGGQIDVYESCPDRITGRKSFAELTSICPERKWCFVAVSKNSRAEYVSRYVLMELYLQVNVPYSETTSHRAEVVSLVYPHNTEMDLSIAYALYFAARGTGLSYSHPSSTAVPYATSAHVLLSGLGADELFGGYGRHAVGFSRAGYRGLLEEIKLDVGRLGKRNLGRDDRVMAHWGREVRFPFLDEDLVLWAIQLPVWEKCDFENPEAGGPSIEPGKRVLRLVAKELGMSGVAREKKRAIQFGSRTAKMESGRVKGTNVIS
ncbi:uncharacterized protein E0L32_002818 [Thyridium curvatum]|uniref:Glutamine amidotransferase type-2 domain-containing protein n=1 Tax=Thyridium curvatum TaxID=1093900 RepID=A0A507BCT4_9PEZI|nr:uncharacterized protein E0L32_002818 [Thyridium curvatum]TPX17717.1 hypothetical protein E0L32_002818 [Thyridium curvatum]